MIKILFSSAYYQLLIFSRVRVAVFFTIAFPVLLFVTFGYIWGVASSKYISFLLSGVLAMNVASVVFLPWVRQYLHTMLRALSST